MTLELHWGPGTQKRDECESHVFQFKVVESRNPPNGNYINEVAID